MRQQAIQSINIVFDITIWSILKNVSQIRKGVKPVFLCGFDYAEHNGAGLGSARSAGEEEIFAIYDKWFYRTF